MKLTPPCVLALFVLAAGASEVFAHLDFERSSPGDGATLSSPPESIRLWFSQEPDVAMSRLTLTGPAGPVALGEVRPAGERSLAAAVGGEMVDGSYTVQWQTAGDDGHVRRGGFGFRLKRAE